MRLAGLFCFVLFFFGGVLFGCFKEIMHSCRTESWSKIPSTEIRTWGFRNDHAEAKDLAQSKFHIHRLHSDSQIHIVSHQVSTWECPPVEMVPRTMLRDTNRCLEGSEWMARAKAVQVSCMMAGPKEEEGAEERAQVRKPGQKFPTASSLKFLVSWPFEPWKRNVNVQDDWRLCPMYFLLLYQTCKLRFT